MKKRLIIVMGLMLILVCSTISLSQASTIATAAREKGTAYILYISGSRGKMAAQGTLGANPRCFTSLRNTYNTTINAYVKVTELDMTTGTQSGYKSASNASLAVGNVVATAGLIRQPNDELRKYVHYAKVKDYQNPTSVIDELAYYIDQVD